jgi:hypothetical protein
MQIAFRTAEADSMFTIGPACPAPQSRCWVFSADMPDVLESSGIGATLPAKFMRTGAGIHTTAANPGDPGGKSRPEHPRRHQGTPRRSRATWATTSA